VLLHGGGLDAARLSWGRLLPVLARGHRVVAPDWPGYGESDKPAHRSTLPYLERTLKRLLDALGIERATLAGVSMGGAVAIGFALRHPERVERLVLIDSYGVQRHAPGHVASFLVAHAPGLTRLIWWLAARFPAASRMMLGAVFHDPASTPDLPWLVHEFGVEARRPGAGRAWRSFQRHETLPSRLRTDYTPLLHRLTPPVLVVHGAHDRLVPLAAARRAARRIPRARLAVIADAGHWSQRERPALVNDLVTRFLG
jgi:pimeloyl-ACP methyl ester carboxylesterase